MLRHTPGTGMYVASRRNVRDKIQAFSENLDVADSGSERTNVFSSLLW